jgi:hypothetical protein
MRTRLVASLRLKPLTTFASDAERPPKAVLHILSRRMIASDPRRSPLDVGKEKLECFVFRKAFGD